MFKTLKIINDVNRTSKKYNILTFNTHERYQTQLAKTGHNFYCFNQDGGKDWIDGHAPMPSNFYQLPKNSVYPGIVFDLIMVNSKFGQFQTAMKINRQLQVPVVVLEHTLPLENWPKEQLQTFQEMKGDIDVFITEYSKRAWGMSGEVIYHSIDTDLFKPGELEEPTPRILTVAHDFINRDYALNYHGWERITRDLPRRVVGGTPGLSEQSDSVEGLIKEYQRSLIYINPSVLSPVPTSMLEAMACGCAIVTTNTCEIPNIIKHNENGLISNDEAELRHFLMELLQYPDKAKELGRKARQTVQEQFSEERFVNEWNTIFDKAIKVKK